MLENWDKLKCTQTLIFVDTSIVFSEEEIIYLNLLFKYDTCFQSCSQVQGCLQVRQKIIG